MNTQLSGKPRGRPATPDFSSGPCAKRPGWSADNLNTEVLGRSHRAAIGKERLKAVIDRSKALLGIPADYVLGIVPGSDTGAVEMALWSMLGQRPVDILAWESFGSGWVTDVTKQLKLDDVRIIEARYGDLPDLATVDFSRDVVFTWNGTTSGVCVPNGDWITDDREGLTICDATSAAFAMDLAWDKLDVVTWSWQKVLGGEAAHGMLALSPRAVARLENYTPPWPMPKLFRMTKSGKLNAGIFKGETINTPSMLAVEDALDTLSWAQSIGGLPALIGRCADSLKALEDWVAESDWAGFLAKEPATRSHTSVCISIIDPWFAEQSADIQKDIPKKLSKLLEDEGVAFDINGYRDAPPGLRIWCGATIEPSDVAALTPWLDWAYATVKAELSS